MAVTYVWDRSGVHLYFHYCPREVAPLIACDGVFLVSEDTHQGRGKGLFLTNRAPGEISDTALLKELFALQRPPSAIEGVVVLRADPDNFPLRRLAAHAWLFDAAPGDLDINLILLGAGVRDQGVWRFDKNLHVP